MAEQEQKIIFGKNLSYYVSKTGKMQKEVAKDLKINPTTFNMWCTGKIMPNVSKIKDLANYFGIFFFDLTEERSSNSARDFYLSPLEKEIISNYITSLCFQGFEWCVYTVCMLLIPPTLLYIVIVFTIMSRGRETNPARLIFLTS